jgi:hypothetical protein
MPTVHLSEEELRETLQRARQIAEQGRELAAPEVDYEAYLKAAEEVGLPRSAVLQALRERQLIPAETFAAGQMVFAPSADGYWYPATLVDLESHTATVRFLSGGEHTCALADLRPLSLIPGRKLEADLKGWGWWSAIVEKYDPQSGKVSVLHDDWMGGKEKVSLQKIRLPAKLASPPKQEEKRLATLSRKILTRWALLAGGAGLAAGILLDRLLPFLLPFLR